MHARCHHPPFVLQVDPGHRVSSRTEEAIVRTAARAAENPSAPLVFMGEALEVAVDVIECSWCRRPFDHVDEAEPLPPRIRVKPTATLEEHVERLASKSATTCPICHGTGHETWKGDRPGEVSGRPCPLDDCPYRKPPDPNPDPDLIDHR